MGFGVARSDDLAFFVGGDVEKFIPINAPGALQDVLYRELLDLGDVLFFVEDIIVFPCDGVDLGSLPLLLFFSVGGYGTPKPGSLLGLFCAGFTFICY